MHIGEAAVDAVVPQGELGVVDAELVKHGRVNVINAGGIRAVLRTETPFVTFPIGAALDAATAEPVGEDEGIVVAPLAALGAGHAAELGGPENERVLEHAPLFEVLDQRGGSMGHAQRERLMITFHILVAVPVAARVAVVVAAPDLYKAHPALQQTPGGQALTAKELGLRLHIDAAVVHAGRFRGQAIHVADVLGLAGEVEGVRGAELHGGREFIGAHPRLKTVVTGMLLRMGPVQAGQHVQPGPVALRGDEVTLWRMEIRNRLGIARPDHRALMLRREKGIGPVFGSVRGQAPVIRKHHKRRQVVAFTAQGMTHPRACAGEAGQLKTRGLQQRALAVHAGLSHHVVNEGDVIRHGPQGSHDVAQHLAAAAMRPEGPRTAETCPRRALKQLHFFPRVPGLAVAFRKKRLVIPHVHMTGRPGHEKLDDTLRPRRMMQPPQNTGRSQRLIPQQQVSECETTKGSEERTSVHKCAGAGDGTLREGKSNRWTPGPGAVILTLWKRTSKPWQMPSTPTRCGGRGV